MQIGQAALIGSKLAELTDQPALRLQDAWLTRPPFEMLCPFCGEWLSGVRVRTLDPGRSLSELDSEGRHIKGDKPTKEAVLHTTMYARRRDAEAIVHLHQTYSVAVSCLERHDHGPILPPITAYYAMRIGSLGFAPYFAPGDPLLADAVGELAGKHHAILLANHGAAVAGTSLSAAADAIEELEETARLFLMLRHEPIRALSTKESMSSGSASADTQ